MKIHALLAPLTAILLIPSLAFADVPPPNSSGCTNKAAGAACMDDAKANGTCQKDTCSRLDYGALLDAGPDASGMPKSVSYDCLKCVAGSGTSSGSSSGASSGSTAAKDGGCALGTQGSTSVTVGLLLALGLMVSRRNKSRAA
jgi:hypothetical protein